MEDPAEAEKKKLKQALAVELGRELEKIVLEAHKKKATDAVFVASCDKMRVNALSEVIDGIKSGLNCIPGSKVEEVEKKNNKHSYIVDDLNRQIESIIKNRGMNGEVFVIKPNFTQFEVIDKKLTSDGNTIIELLAELNKNVSSWSCGTTMASFQMGYALSALFYSWNRFCSRESTWDNYISAYCQFTPQHINRYINVYYLIMQFPILLYCNCNLTDLFVARKLIREYLKRNHGSLARWTYTEIKGPRFFIVGNHVNSDGRKVSIPNSIIVKPDGEYDLKAITDEKYIADLVLAKFAVLFPDQNNTAEITDANNAMES